MDFAIAGTADMLWDSVSTHLLSQIPSPFRGRDATYIAYQTQLAADLRTQTLAVLGFHNSIAFCFL